MTNWSRGNAIASGAGGLGFESRASQSGHSVLPTACNAATFLEKELRCLQAQWRGDGPRPTRYTLRRNTVNIIKDLNVNS